MQNRERNQKGAIPNDHTRSQGGREGPKTDHEILQKPLISYIINHITYIIYHTSYNIDNLSVIFLYVVLWNSFQLTIITGSCLKISENAGDPTSVFIIYLRMYFRVCFTLSISFWSMFPRQIVNNDGTCITNLAWVLRRLSFPCSKHQLTSSSNFSSKSVSHWIAESVPTNKSKKIIIFLSF